MLNGRTIGAKPWLRPGLRSLRRRLIDILIRLSRRSLAGPLRFIGRVMLFLVVALGSGLGSAWYMIQVGSPLTVEQIGPWTRWVGDGRPGADPYTRAYHARAGRLPLSSAQAHYFLATADSAGDHLFGDCEYDLAGRPLASVWWSLGIYDTGGALIENDFRRYALTGDTIVRGASGGYVVRLAKDARPGNWLPVGTDGRFVVMLRAYQPAAASELAGTGRAQDLPAITKVSCR